jgi:hypothetical protein
MNVESSELMRKVIENVGDVQNILSGVNEATHELSDGGVDITEGERFEILGRVKTSINRLQDIERFLNG